MSWDLSEFIDSLGVVLFAVLLAAGLTFGAVCLYKTSAADGNVDFCVVEYDAPLYRVTGHKPWRSDATIARVPSLAEAVQAAAAVACPVGARK